MVTQEVTLLLRRDKDTAVSFVEGKGMFCLLCRKHDCQNPQNKTAVFNKTPATWYRPATLKEHVGTPLSTVGLERENNTTKMQFTGRCCKEPHFYDYFAECEIGV